MVSTGDYSDWGIKRTIREAENVARWNPWKAHEWMNEARDRMDLDNMFFDFYNAVRNALSLKLSGDSAFTGYIAKNPTYKGNFFDKNNNVKTKEKFKIMSFNNDGWELGGLADY